MKKYKIVDFDESLILESFDVQDCIDAFLKLHPYWGSIPHEFIYKTEVYFNKCPASEYTGILLNPSGNKNRLTVFLKKFKRWLLKK